MPRPPLPIGTAGEVTTRELPNGKHEARCRYRDYSGTTRQLRKTGTTPAAAKRALKETVRDYTRNGRTDQLTPDSTLETLSKLWITHIENEGGRTPQTLSLYQANLNRHIVPALGNVRIREATTGRIDAYFVALTSASVAKTSRVVLTGMFALAARHDVIEYNPVRDATIKRSKRTATRALTDDEIKTLRANIVSYQNAAHYGPQRGSDALEVVDVFLGTGMRAGEVFALRWADVDLDAEVPTVTVAATVVTITGEGLVRQAHPKSDSSNRVVVLPPFAVEALRRQQGRRLPSADGLVFPSAAGTLRSPNNFARVLRDARGEELGWVSPHSFRRTHATLVERMFGLDAAAAVLGHSDSTITRRHYVQRASQAPDVSAAFAGIG